MGYDLHITRKNDWTDEEHPIAVDEWRQTIASDPRLVQDPNDPDTAFLVDAQVEWLTWNRGTIYTKNPSERMVDEMIRLASNLNARVLGDDGEEYQPERKVVPAPGRNVMERVRNWWTDRTAKIAPLEPVEAPFQVGDRVREIFGDQNPGTIAKIDATANNGLGTIVVNYNDGRVGSWFCVGHGLELREDVDDTSVDGAPSDRSS
jgi:hypothetical protein